MSFCKLKNIIEEGDTVVIYLSPKQMYPVKIVSTETFQTRFGAIRLDQLIGKRYGCRIECSKGFVHVLDMTPELWTQTLPHRTQILYGPDISLILMQLQIKSGSTVVEAGTGSGSLSHSIARTIAPNGKLFTFDFHEERVLAAREEFREHEIDHLVDIQHRDVCTDGFKLEQKVDAVFLDLPHPWEAIESAQKVLKSGSRICCFSPCIEQVQRSYQQLTKLNFYDIETFECILRPYEVRQMSLKKVQLCDTLSFNQKSKMECDQEGGDDGDFKDNNDSTTNNNININDDDGDDDDDDDDEDPDQELDKQSKKIKLESNDLDKSYENHNTELNNTTTNSHDSSSSQSSNEINYWITYMNSEIAGHTGFLTFATNFLENNSTQ